MNRRIASSHEPSERRCSGVRRGYERHREGEKALARFARGCPLSHFRPVLRDKLAHLISTTNILLLLLFGDACYKTSRFQYVMPTVARCGTGAVGFFEWHASCPTLLSKADAAEETFVVGAHQASGAHPTTRTAAAGPTPPLPGPATRPPARISGRGFFVRTEALDASSA